MQTNPQPAADTLLMDEAKLLDGNREDLEHAIELAAVLMQALHPLVAKMDRSAVARQADQKRIVALTSLIVRLIGQLRKLSGQAATDANGSPAALRSGAAGEPFSGPLNLIHRNNSPKSIGMRVPRGFGGTK